jgi:hypothetical protein
LPHELASHPLFQLPALMELAERTRKQRPGDIYYNNGEVRCHHSGSMGHENLQ